MFEDDLRRVWGCAGVRRRLVRLLRSAVPEGVELCGWSLGVKPRSEWKGVAWCLDEKSERIEGGKSGVLLLRSLGTADLSLYTDGSLAEGVRSGGADVIVTRGDLECKCSSE